MRLHWLSVTILLAVTSAGYCYHLHENSLLCSGEKNKDECPFTDGGGQDQLNYITNDRYERSCPALSLEALEFFRVENEKLADRKHRENLAAYEYNTNVTEENRRAMISIAAIAAAENKELAKEIQASNYDSICDPNIRRQVNKLSDLGHAVLPEDEYLALQNAISSMQTNYATSAVCAYEQPENCTLTLEPHIQERLANSRDAKELAHYWRAWHDRAGTPMRGNFSEYIRLSRKAAKMNNFHSNADYWVHFYEDSQFEEHLDAAYRRILPFYAELHAYVRHRLREHYGPDVVPLHGNIPMHLLGNMWAQSWEQIIELLKPYPERPFIDVNAELARQNYTVRRMFELGDEFFQSLGMRALPSTFWERSVLERPVDRQVVCHASAWDLFKDSDVRIKMCTEVDTHYLYVVHHELGHIQYYLQYENQPAVFRDAPNPGFHEAVGDVIALSVSSPKHLQRIGLSPIGTLDDESRINELFLTALKKAVFLPFAYTMDKYRYAVFRNEVEPSDWNCAFWRLRSEYSGVEPPVRRSNRDFDPPAKYHIDADVEYLRYFAAHIFQFQFHRALCERAGQYVAGDSSKTLDNCDIFQSREAGKAFMKLLSAGGSRHWKEVLEEFTGETEMDATAFLNYFEPLHKWLREENKLLGVPVGWDDTNKLAGCCEPFST